MAESTIMDEAYFQVQGWMLNRLKLKGVALQVFAIIYGFSQDGESCFKGSLQYLMDFTGASKPTVIKALKELVERGYVIKTEKAINGLRLNDYKVSLPVVKKLYLGSKETLLDSGKETLPGGSKETLPHNKSLDIKSLDIKDTYTIIIAYLNEKAGTAYKPTSKATQSHINARLADGFTVEDFRTVIDKKCTEWKGGEMEKFLRPETLFGPKFESYLNAKIIKKTNGGRKEAVPDWMERDNTSTIEQMRRMHAKMAGNNPAIAARAEALKQELRKDT